MTHPLSDPRVTNLPDDVISSKKQVIALFLSDDGLASIPTWEERAWKWSNFRNHKIPKQGRVHKIIPYMIQYDTLSDGTAIFLRHPTRYGWTDFIWKVTKPFITVDGREITNVSLYDIKDVLWVEKRANPVGFEVIANLLQQYTETAVKPDPKILKAYPCVTGNDMERIFAAIGVSYMEQWNKNNIGLNLLMSYGLYPPSREHIAQNIKMAEGELGLFYSLHGNLTHHMDLAVLMNSIKDHWQYNSKDKSQGTRFYDSDGYLPGIDGPAHIVYTRTKEFVFAYGKDNADIFLDDLDLAPGELRVHIHEEHNDQDSLEFWFNNDIRPSANSFDGICAYFDNGYVRLDGNGKATVCLYQDWTEEEIVKTINRQQKMTIHQLEE